MALSKRAPVHFMGAGGAGMSPLAELILRSGGQVSGCDRRTSSCGVLADLGATLFEGHDPSHVENVSALVITAAVPTDHPEVQAAIDRGIPVLKRAQALGSWVNQGRVVAIAGTHGKTTTTAITTGVLTAAGMDPTGLVGGHVTGWDGNLRFGQSDLFVVEADEYDRSFHTLTPAVAVITNLEADHLDIYGDLDGVREGFQTFVDGLHSNGTLLCCADDPGAARMLSSAGGRGRSYGLSAGSQLRALDVSMSYRGAEFTVVEAGGEAGRFSLPVPGLHNVRNALAAIAVARVLGASWEHILEGLAGFPGVSRRFSQLGLAGGVEVIDDYAHHPSELEAALEAARSTYPSRRVVAVFQPHLYSRTNDFFQEFGQALCLADRALVTDIFPAREEPMEGVTGELVHKAVLAEGGESTYHASLDSLAEAVFETLEPGDVCIVMGAGSIEATGPRILSLLKESAGGAT